MILSGVWIAISGAQCAVYAHDRHQQIRFWALVSFSIAVAGGSFDRMGEGLNWRMPLAALGLGLTLWGLRPFVRERKQEAERDDEA